MFFFVRNSQARLDCRLSISSFTRKRYTWIDLMFIVGFVIIHTRCTWQNFPRSSCVRNSTKYYTEVEHNERKTNFITWLILLTELHEYFSRFFPERDSMRRSTIWGMYIEWTHRQVWHNTIYYKENFTFSKINDPIKNNWIR